MNNNFPEIDKTLHILKSSGGKTVKEIAQELKITVEGARFQLLKLTGENLVKSENRAKGRGRPQQIWSLTEKGHAQFPDTHPELTVKLISKIREQLGEDALDKIIYSSGEDNLMKYKESINESDELTAKLDKLTELRTAEGYMAGYVKNDDGSYLLYENHCPICAAASKCQQFCKAELNTFHKVLGEEIKIERIDHILAGARRCAYLVKK